MYEFLRGKLVEIATPHLILDVNGVGYKLPFPLSHFSLLPLPGSELLVFTSFVIKEASQTIYAFLTRLDRDLFEQLITISGIGPKTALAIIGHMSLDELEQAIQSHNVLLLSKIPGIGKKTAERLIIELKDKLNLFQGKETVVQTLKHPSLVKDALNALLNLGFQPTFAQQAIKKAMATLPENPELSEVISLALRLK